MNPFLEFVANVIDDLEDYHYRWEDDAPARPVVYHSKSHHDDRDDSDGWLSRSDLERLPKPGPDCFEVEMISHLMGLAILAIIGTGIGGYFGVTKGIPAHHDHAHTRYWIDAQAAARNNTQLKPLSHWFCQLCRSEDKFAETFKTPALAPDVFQATVKPICTTHGVDRHIKQVVLKGKGKTSVAFIPADSQEITLIGPHGTKVIQLNQPTPKTIEVPAKPQQIEVKATKLSKKTFEQKAGQQDKPVDLSQRKGFKKMPCPVAYQNRVYPVFKNYTHQYS